MAGGDPGGAVAMSAMRPVVLHGCTGWLHVPDRPRALGVVLCPALGREARWSYRAMRQLADRLAASGMPTLRFDYPGTGESPDLPAWEEPFDAWRQSVHEAVDWLRAQTGIDQVGLCGLRFGALLAADVAATRHDIAALALLGPILTGRTCTRELRIASFGGEDDDGPVHGIEVDGLVLPDATLARIGTLDLRAAEPPAGRILILDSGSRADALAGHFRSQGVPAALEPFAGIDAMMRPGTSNEVPHAALGLAAAWLGAAVDPAQPAPTLRPMPSLQTLTQPEWRERVVQFGPDARLAGVLCEPAGGAGSGRATLIPNTGGEPRSGIGRFGVHLARSLALAGTASLRFDFAGLGDSVLPDDAASHPYQTGRGVDIAAALDLLQSAGYRRLGGVGVCTGAYHLLHAAGGDPRLQHLALLNLVTARWRPGDAVEVPQRALGHGLAPSGPQPVGSEETRQPIEAVLDQGVRLLLLYGQGDPGLAALEADFGTGGRDLGSRATIRVEAAIDHTLSRRTMQDRVIGAVSGFLLEQASLVRA